MGGDSERRTRNEIRRELIDSFDEELEMELDDGCSPTLPSDRARGPEDRARRLHYFKELFRLQGELVKLQDWVVHTGQGWWSCLRAATPRARAASSSASRSG